MSECRGDGGIVHLPLRIVSLVHVFQEFVRFSWLRASYPSGCSQVSPCPPVRCFSWAASLRMPRLGCDIAVAESPSRDSLVVALRSAPEGEHHY
jgi:hypothetical protein